MAKFNKGDVVVVRHGDRDFYIQVQEGPFKWAANDEQNCYRYQGWQLISKNDPYSEGLLRTFIEESARLATEEEIAANTQGRLKLVEGEW